MGWLYKYAVSRKDLIKERTKDWERTTEDGMTVTTTRLAHCYRGGSFAGVLWTVWERAFTKDGVEAQPTERWIGCDLLRYQSDAWGYKDLEESMHPYYYSCPRKYLNLVPIERFGGNEVWRAGVERYHARQQAKRKLRTPAKAEL